MFNIKFETKPFIQGLDVLALQQLPYATMQALNDTMFQVREAWRDEMLRVFDRPTPFVLNSVLYKKATRTNLVAEVSIRESGGKGVAPVKPLLAEAYGGVRRAKASEILLSTAGVISNNEYIVPAKGFKLDAFGNVARGTMQAILSDVQATFDKTAFSTAASRGKRAKRRARGKNSIYFYNPGNGKLPRGIYERTGGAFGSSIRMALAIVTKPPTYAVRFHAEETAQRLFDERFPANFNDNLARAIASSDGRARP